MAGTSRTTAVAAARGAIGAVALAVILSGCIPMVTPAPPADLGITTSIDNASPYYRRDVVITVTVDAHVNRSSAGVTVSAPLPTGLTYVSSSGGYDAATATWTIGTVAGGGHAVLTMTAQAGDVSAGDQTVTATVHSATTDSNLANNTASVSEHSVPAPVTLAMVPNPGNPVFVDISAPGTIGWTASLTATDNPTATTPQGTFQWICETVSLNPCPVADGTNLANQPALSYQIGDLGIDSYIITLTADVADPNYQSGSYQTSLTFTTTNSGG